VSVLRVAVDGRSRKFVQTELAILAVEAVCGTADPSRGQPFLASMTGKVFCPFCGGPFPAELVSCPHCGGPAPGRERIA
jgi:hypothetical protein